MNQTQNLLLILNQLNRVQPAAQENKIAIFIAAVFLMLVIIVIELLILKLNKESKGSVILDQSLSHMAQQHKDIDL